MRLPNQPNQYDRNLEQQRSATLEREIVRILAELAKLKEDYKTLDDRLKVLEP